MARRREESGDGREWKWEWKKRGDGRGMRGVSIGVKGGEKQKVSYHLFTVAVNSILLLIIQIAKLFERQ